MNLKNIKSKIPSIGIFDKSINFLVEKLGIISTVVNSDNLKFLDSISYFDTPDIRELYYIHGNEYWTCIQLYELSKEVKRKILDGFMHSNQVLVMIDEEPLTNNEAVTFLGGKVDQETSGLELNNKYKSFITSKDKIESNQDFINYLRGTNENAKTVTIRLYLHCGTLEELNRLIESVTDLLREREFKGCIQTNNLDNDLKAMTQFNEPCKQLISSRGMSNLLMSNNISVVDDNVSVLGVTETGVFAPDFTNYRNSSFGMAVIGMQGSGKSSLIKLVSEGATLQNEQTIIFDMHVDEYAGITERYDIPSINFNKQKYINPCQIFNVTNADGVICEEDISRTISLNSSIYGTHSEKANEGVLQQLRKHMHEMYSKYKGHKLSEFKNEDWFIRSDIEKYIMDKEKNNEYDDVEKTDIYNLRLGLIDSIKTYGFLFNHHTNVEIDLTKSLRFNLSFLLEMNDEPVLNAYITLLLNYIGKALVMNEHINNEMEKGYKGDIKRPFKPAYVIFEETGTLFKYEAFLDTVDTLIRQTRKGRVAFVFALHTIQDIDDDKINKMKSIFGLCPNIIIGQVDNQTAEKLPFFVKGLTDREAKMANHFRKDENGARSFIACNDREEKVLFKTIVTTEQREYFGGGK